MALKWKLLVSFLILSFIAILIAVTGSGLILIKFILDNYIPVFRGYSAVVFVVGVFYLYVNKEKGVIGLLGATILDCAAIIATFWTGINYFHELFSVLSDFLSILSDKILPFMMANVILLYWSLSQFFDKLGKIFRDIGLTSEIMEGWYIKLLKKK